MSDEPNAPNPVGAGTNEQATAEKAEAATETADTPALREPFPFVRILFTILFGIVASFVFWIIVLLAVLQFATIAIAGEKNDELKRFCRLTARYMQEMFDYMTLASDERPFPLGPFPKD